MRVVHATVATGPDSPTDEVSVSEWNADHTIEGLATVATSGAFADLTTKPTTIAGYGITDAETAITAGTTAQYWRGDKSWQTLDKIAAGLANVDNTSDANKPVSTATQTALDGKQAVGSYLTANQTITLSGDASGSGTTAITVAIGAGKVTLAMQANMATASVVYRKTAGAGAPEVQTLATLKADLGLTGTNGGDQTITLTGDVTGGGTGSFAATLATVNANVGSFGSASTVATFTVNGKGLTTAAAGVAIQIAESQVTNLATDLAAKAPLASPQFTGVSYYQQVSPTAKTASATLTIAELQTLIITATSTTAVSLTLPTGTLTDAGILSGALAVNEAFEWYVINLGSSSGAVTMVAGTGHTIVGSATVAIATSARFLTRKTATNTFVTYRIA